MLLRPWRGPWLGWPVLAVPRLYARDPENMERLTSKDLDGSLTSDIPRKRPNSDGSRGCTANSCSVELGTKQA